MRIVCKTEDQARNAAAELGRQFVKHRERGLLVTIQIFAPPKTHKQNAKLHAMLSELADNLGYSKDELSDSVMAQYGPTKTLNIAGEHNTVPKRLSEYSRAEAAAMIEHLYRIASECHVQLTEGKGDD